MLLLCLASVPCWYYTSTFSMYGTVVWCACQLRREGRREEGGRGAINIVFASFFSALEEKKYTSSSLSRSPVNAISISSSDRESQLNVS